MRADMEPGWMKGKKKAKKKAKPGGSPVKNSSDARQANSEIHVKIKPHFKKNINIARNTIRKTKSIQMEKPTNVGGPGYP